MWWSVRDQVLLEGDPLRVLHRYFAANLERIEKRPTSISLDRINLVVLIEKDAQLYFETVVEGGKWMICCVSSSAVNLKLNLLQTTTNCVTTTWKLGFPNLGIVVQLATRGPSNPSKCLCSDSRKRHMTSSMKMPTRNASWERVYLLRISQAGSRRHRQGVRQIQYEISGMFRFLLSMSIERLCVYEALTFI